MRHWHWLLFLTHPQPTKGGLPHEEPAVGSSPEELDNETPPSDWHSLIHGENRNTEIVKHPERKAQHGAVPPSLLKKTCGLLWFLKTASLVWRVNNAGCICWEQICWSLQLTSHLYYCWNSPPWNELRENDSKIILIFLTTMLIATGSGLECRSV